MIVFLNPNTSPSTTSTMVAIAGAVRPDIPVAGMTAAFGAPIIVEQDALEVGGRAVETMALALCKGVRGVVISAFGDPGLEVVRNMLQIPVTGIGEASFLEAGQDGRPFAIATTTPLLDDAIRKRVAKSPVAAQFIGCRYTKGDPALLTSQPERLLDALNLAVEQSISDGAEAVIIGGGPLAVAAREIGRNFSVPIIEPLPAAMRRICGLLDL